MLCSNMSFAAYLLCCKLDENKSKGLPRRDHRAYKLHTSGSQEKSHNHKRTDKHSPNNRLPEITDQVQSPAVDVQVNTDVGN